MKPSRELKTYAAGMLATFAGAWGTELSSSMWPLALGASVSLMCTAPLVRRLWRGRRSALPREPR
jgi:hypothetical protein